MLTRKERFAENYKEVVSCRKCAIAERPVFGSGRCTGLMFVGEAAGADEVKHGIPFVGRAGQLFNDMLAQANLSRDDFFITNIVRCRPTTISPYGNTVNRPPLPEEISSCIGYLDTLVEILSPVLIVAVGNVAGKVLVARNFSVMKDRGKFKKCIRYDDVETVGIIHPSYFLRNGGKQDGIFYDSVLDLINIKKRWQFLLEQTSWKEKMSI